MTLGDKLFADSPNIGDRTSAKSRSDTPFKYNNGNTFSIVAVRRIYGGMSADLKLIFSAPCALSLTRGTLTATVPTPVINERSGR